MPIDRALEEARKADLDLVEVAPGASPPVCRIMDYGKYKYQQSKKAQEAKKKQVVIQIKEIKIRPKTDEHDYQFKVQHLIRFLNDGNKAKVSVIFRGREMMHAQLGLKMLERIIEEVKEVGVVEQKPKLEGKTMSMLLVPKAKSGEQKPKPQQQSLPQQSLQQQGSPQQSSQQQG
jgi:translation initiation factor IF-3